MSHGYMGDAFPTFGELGFFPLSCTFHLPDPTLCSASVSPAKEPFAYGHLDLKIRRLQLKTIGAVLLIDQGITFHVTC